jgi:intergrase/recombinase
LLFELEQEAKERQKELAGTRPNSNDLGQKIVQGVENEHANKTATKIAEIFHTNRQYVNEELLFELEQEAKERREQTQGRPSINKLPQKIGEVIEQDNNKHNTETATKIAEIFHTNRQYVNEELMEELGKEAKERQKEFKGNQYTMKSGVTQKIEEVQNEQDNFILSKILVIFFFVLILDYKSNLRRPKNDLFVLFEFLS